MDLTWWPLFGLRVRTPRVELAPFTDDDADEYAAVLGGGLHPPGEMPFGVPFTDAEPPQLQRSALQFHWGLRASWKPEAWHLACMVRVDGRIVGQQDLMATEFGVRRVVSTGSWLGLAEQGRGIGTEMRAAVLHLGFAGLGAQRAETSAWSDNGRSQGVTRRLGYEPDGEGIQVRRGEATTMVRFALSRSRWEVQRRDDIVIEGLDAARALFGA